MSRSFPPRFTSYIRASACPTNSSTDGGGGRYVTAPMLNVTGHPPRCIASNRCFRKFHMHCAAASCPVSGSRTANSSPPSRATASVGRVVARMIWATARRTSSPTW